MTLLSVREVLLFLVVAATTQLSLSGDVSCSPRNCPNLFMLCPTHPDIDKLLAENAPRYTLPRGHISVNGPFQGVQDEHSNIDRLLLRGERYEDEHPKLNPYMGAANDCRTAPVPAAHVDIDAAMRRGEPAPAGHPPVQGLFGADYLRNHKNIDAILRESTAYPRTHLPLSSYLTREPLAPAACAVSMPAAHPDVTLALQRGDPLPWNHPPIHQMFQNNVLRGHTNIDLIYATKKPLPWNHPLLEPYLCKEALAPAACAVDIPAAHPDITAALARGDVLPSDHPSVHSMFRGDVLKGHTNIDYIYWMKTPMPTSHPALEPYLCREALAPAACAVDIPAAHPDITESLRRGDALPLNHPPLDPMFTGDALKGHTSIDLIYANKTPLPSSHPSLTPYLCREALAPATCAVDIPASHPDITEALQRGDALPLNHPPLDPMFTGDALKGHTSIDLIYANKIPLPSSHPALKPYLCRQTLAPAACAVDIPAAHPDITEALRNNDPLPADHPPVHSMFRGDVLNGHTNIDKIYADKTPLPPSHPSLTPYVCREALAPAACAVDIPASHPDITEALRRGDELPLNHPPLDPMFTGDALKGHTSIDLIYANKTPLPSLHPALKPYLCREALAPAACAVDIPAAHPDITETLRRGDELPLNHPPVHAMFSGDVLKGHTNLDVIYANEMPLPAAHPSLTPYMCREPLAQVAACVVDIPAVHPDITLAMQRGDPLPANHPPVHNMFPADVMKGHTNLDVIYAYKIPLPSAHPSLEPYICRETISMALQSLCATVNPSHIDVDAFLAAGETLEEHPKIHLMFGSLLDGHPNVDDLMARGEPLPPGHPTVQQYLCVRSQWSPAVVQAMFVLAAFVVALFGRYGKKMLKTATATVTHSKSKHKYQPSLTLPPEEGGDDLKSTALSVVPVLSAPPLCEMPPPAAPPVPPPPKPPPPPRDVNATVRATPPIFVSAAVAAARVQRQQQAGALPPIPPIPGRVGGCGGGSGGGGGGCGDGGGGGGGGGSNVGVRHRGPPPGRSGRGRSPRMAWPPTRPPPRTHRRDLSAYRNETFYRTRHVDSDLQLGLSNKDTDAGVVVDIGVGIEASIIGSNSLLPTHNRDASATSVNQKWSLPEKSSTRGEPSVLTPEISSAVYEGRIGGDGVDDEEDELFESYDETSAKENSCLRRFKNVVLQARIPFTHWTTQNFLVLFAYAAVNLVALYFSGLANRHIGGKRTVFTDIDRGLGSIAVVNLAIGVIPATRNSVLTWCLGMPFDHVVLYHRFIGRFAIFAGVMHGVLYFERFLEDPGAKWMWTGAGALLCGLIIFVTSTDYIRRNHFNVFFFSHYSFIGYLGLGFAHVPEAKPFLGIAIGLYVLDRLLRTAWSMLPQRPQVMRLNGSDVVQMVFKKTVCTKALDMHKVGQYYFINVPSLSLTEWHPFSVSSSPREDIVELHIRNLGDWTGEVCKLTCALDVQRAAAAANADADAAAAADADAGVDVVPPRVRVDGPYGKHDFNYRRFPVLVLAGGGIGITPVVGMLKDIYDYGAQPLRGSHSNQIICCVWVIPHRRDFDAFADVLAHCVATSKKPGYPTLRLAVHVSRAKDEDALTFPLVKGRPDFSSLFDDLGEQHPKQASLVFACGPSKMVNDLWDLSVQRSRKYALVNFHHETFEF